GVHSSPARSALPQAAPHLAPVKLETNVFFFFNDTAPTEIYPLSLHDALPISDDQIEAFHRELAAVPFERRRHFEFHRDRKSTRLNSSHRCISYAVFFLKK